MGFLQRIFRRSLSPSWTLTPGGFIWKLQPTPGGILFGEARDVEKKKMSLFAVRPSSGEALFSGVELREPWWIALEMTIGEVAILHMFPRPDLPNALGATAVDCATGATLWNDPELRVLCGVEELAMTQRGDSHDWSSLALIDARTGTVLEEIGESAERVEAFQEACAVPAQWDGWINSNELDPDSTLALRLEPILSAEIKERRGPVEVAEFGNYLVAGVHARSRGSAQAMLGNLIDTHLLVMQGENVVVHEIVTRDAPGPSSDIFFIWRGVLIFIRDRETLVGINLNGT